MKRERIYACTTPGCENEGRTRTIQPIRCCDHPIWPIVECLACEAEVPYYEFELEAT